VESEVKAFHEKHGVEPDAESLAQEYGEDEVKFCLMKTIRVDAPSPVRYLEKTLENRKQEGQAISHARQPRRDTTFTDTLTFRELYNRVNPVKVSIMGEQQVITEGMLRQLVAKVEAGIVSDGDRFLIWLAIYTMIGYNNPDMAASREIEDMDLRDRIYTYYQRKGDDPIAS